LKRTLTEPEATSGKEKNEILKSEDSSIFETKKREKKIDFGNEKKPAHTTPKGWFHGL